MAPEIYKSENYGFKVDNFAVGCIMYYILRGFLPFDSEDNDEIMENTINNIYDLEEEFWSNTSKDCKDLIKKLLEPDQSKRIDME